MLSSLQFEIKNRTQVKSYLDELPRRMVEAIRTGMFEGITGFAELVASRVHSRTGDLALAIAKSARIRDSGTQITGTIQVRNRKGLPIGLWIEEGTSEPATDKLLAFVSPQGGGGRGDGFSHGHKAFKVPAHPFINPSMEEYQQTILDKIRVQLEGAIKI